MEFFMPFKNAHPLYACWRGMISRCENKNHPSYKDYGGRGISVCERWSIRGGVGFRNFVSDMGDRPDSHSIDRIDNDLGYFKENCKWSNKAQQQLNRRVTVIVQIDGKTYKAAELARQVGIKTDAIVERVKNGLTYDEIMSPERRVYRLGLALGGAVSAELRRNKTHCRNGHEYNEQNTKISPKGWRLCKQCGRQQEAKRRAYCGA
jgi:hypothetical protein